MKNKDLEKVKKTVSESNWIYQKRQKHSGKYQQQFP